MTKKPTLLLLGKIPPPYMGPAIATEILLKSDLKRHFTIEHLDTRANRDLRDIGKWSFSKLKTYTRLYRSMQKLLKEKSPDLALIPISQSWSGFLKDAGFILLASQSRVPVMIQLRGSEFRTWFEKLSPPKKSIVRAVLNRCAGALVLGQKLRPIFEGLIPEDRIFVVPNGANYTLPEKNPSPEDVLRLLYIGNLQASKGILDFLKALHLLKTQYGQKVEASVLGAWRDESTRQMGLQIVAEGNLSVQFYDSQQSHLKSSLLSSHDLFVFPPRAPEGHPWVIVEALAAQLPVISTDQGAISESVFEGKNGFLVPHTRPDEIAGRIDWLIKNPSERKRMGEESRKLYLDNFTEEKMVNRLTAALMSILRPA